MKGALLQRIFALFSADSILSDNIIEYVNPPYLNDMPDNGLITKSMMTAYVPGITEPVITPITAGVTANPIEVSYGSISYPALIFRNADGSNYSGATNNTDTGTSIILTGDDDGTGHFADTFTFIIKP